MSNAFRDPLTGKLLKDYLRTCAVYRLLKHGRITSKARAVELLAQRKVKPATAVVEMWLRYPLKHLAVSA